MLEPEAGVKGGRALDSDVELNYSFSELGGGRSTLKMTAGKEDALGGAAAPYSKVQESLMEF